MITAQHITVKRFQCTFQLHGSLQLPRLVLRQLRHQRRPQLGYPTASSATASSNHNNRATFSSVNETELLARSAATESSSLTTVTLLQPNHRTHLIFGANTDVGKTILTTGLIRASLLRHTNHHPNNTMQQPQKQQQQHVVNYIKPLQCGSLETGGDQGFVEKYVANLIPTKHTDLDKNSHHPTSNHDNSNDNIHNLKFTAQTLFRWSTPASPHLASQIEHRPVSDVEILDRLHTTLLQNDMVTPSHNNHTITTTYIETAGGVLSPSSASPNNRHPQRHVMKVPPLPQSDYDVSDEINTSHWGWTLQGDLYRQSSILLSQSTLIVLIGDGRLGGISSTISAMESLLIRGYDIAAILFLEPSTTTTSLPDNEYTEGANVQAIRDYVSSRQLRSGNGEALFPFPKKSIVSLPSIPIDPNVPLYDWYESPIVTSIFQNLEHYISNSWEDYIYDLRSTVRTIQSSNDNPIWIPGSTDQFCRRLYVHNTANGNDNDSASSTVQVIQSPSKCSTDHDENSSGSSSTQSSSMSIGATTSNTQNVLQCQSIIDASGSWWTQSGLLHANSNTSMILAMAATTSRYGGHISGTPPASCMIHTPLLLLSQTLQRYHKKWATHVYYSDDGGTSAIEVAIKMGFKTYQQRMNLSANEIEQTHWIIAAQESCYHGDTLGAMNIMESYVSAEHPWYQECSFCLPTPTIGYQQGTLSITFPAGMVVPDDVTHKFNSIHDVMDIHIRSISPKLLSLYKEMIEMQWLAHEHRTQQKIGCAILEPILQFAGGMKFVDPLWQAAMIDVAQSRNIPVILDESSTGLYRLGIRSCSQILLRDPDIAIYSKLLTGGTYPLSAVVTSKNVYEACLEAEFLYGNTMVANPIACASALYALSMYDAYQKQQQLHNARAMTYSSQPYQLFDEERVKQISLLPLVKQCFTLGSVLTVTLHSPNDDINTKSEISDMAPRLVQTLLDRKSILIGLNQVSHNGDVVYIIVPPFTGTDECNRITDILYKAIREL